MKKLRDIVENTGMPSMRHLQVYKKLQDHGFVHTGSAKHANDDELDVEEFEGVDHHGNSHYVQVYNPSEAWKRKILQRERIDHNHFVGVEHLGPEGTPDFIPVTHPKDLDDHFKDHPPLKRAP
jgi:hypothetical protein